jgi:PHD/YefM family antitoxin component YafN of YafNO toxin-antitoxin module
MREATLEEFVRDVEEMVVTAQHERIVLMRNGHPVAVVVGIENKDEEDWHYMSSPEFWQMIEERRRCSTAPWEEVKVRLFGDEER